MIAAFQFLLVLWIFQSIGLLVEAYREWLSSDPVSPKFREWLRLPADVRKEMDAGAFSEGVRPVVVTFRCWLILGFATAALAFVIETI